MKPPVLISKEGMWWVISSILAKGLILRITPLSEGTKKSSSPKSVSRAITRCFTLHYIIQILHFGQLNINSGINKKKGTEENNYLIKSSLSPFSPVLRSTDATDNYLIILRKRFHLALGINKAIFFSLSKKPVFSYASFSALYEK